MASSTLETIPRAADQYRYGPMPVPPNSKHTVHAARNSLNALVPGHSVLYSARRSVRAATGPKGGRIANNSHIQQFEHLVYRDTVGPVLLETARL